MEEIWRRDGNSEDELDIKYRNSGEEMENIQSSQVLQSSDKVPSNQPVEVISDSDNSQNIPLARNQNNSTTTRKIFPSEIRFTLGDKSTKNTKTRKNIARKSLARKTKEPRQTLAPQWNIIEHGTITGYSPHTITIDKPLRKNTVIRKNDLAIVTEKKALPTRQTVENKPRLIHMVACKTVGEYKRNQEKIKKFCLEEAKQKKMLEPTQSASKMNTNWTPDQMKKVAIKNQKRQQTIRKTLVTPKKGTNSVKKKTSRKRTRTPKKSPGEEFSQGSRQAALQSSSQFDANRSFLTIDAVSILQSENAKQFNIDSDSSPKIITSNDPSLFM